MEREATESEIIEMENIVKDAMVGAVGFSTSTFEGQWAWRKTYAF